MYIAMNRFKIAPGREQDFVSIWRERESHLGDVPGFQSFHLLQGPRRDDHTLFASYTVWESKAHFDAWTDSEPFKRAHAGAGGAKDIYLGPPQFEGFEVVL